MQTNIIDHIVPFIAGVGFGIGVIVALFVFIGRRILRNIDIINEVKEQLTILQTEHNLRTCRKKRK